MFFSDVETHSTIIYMRMNGKNCRRVVSLQERMPLEESLLHFLVQLKMRRRSTCKIV